MSLEIRLGDLLVIILTAIVLWYTARAVILKFGTRLRGSFGITSSVSCDDRYISHVTIQNQKDRAVVIFKVLLYIEHGYYIELDDFESKPLILGPFEVWHRDYEPIEMYTMNARRVDMNELLGRNSYKGMRLALSTAEGKYVVRDWIKRWEPYVDFFKNHTTAIVSTRRSNFEGKSYGSNAKYVVQFTLADGTQESVPIYANDYSIQKFRKFRLTRESLDSKTALEELLLEQAVAGLLPIRDLKVHDLETWRAEVYDSERKEPAVVAHPQSWIVYKLLGPLVTRWNDWKLRGENRAAQKRQLAEAQAKLNAAKSANE